MRRGINAFAQEENKKLVTPKKCPSRTCICIFFGISYTLTVLFLEPDTKQVQQGEKATDKTESECPVNTFSQGIGLIVAGREPGRPCLFFGQVSASDPSKPTILLYNHIDKQPHGDGWTISGPTQPVILDQKLYGRGGADDGYGLPAGALAVKLLQQQNTPHGRIIFLAEQEQESGSQNLNYYIRSLKQRIGELSLLICLDSGIQDYERLWVAKSLRGVIEIDVKVTVAKNGQHSGSVSGIVPDTFRIFRSLLSRIQDENTGEILVDELNQKLGLDVYQDALEVVKIVGDSFLKKLPLVEGARPTTDDLLQMYINRTWKPTLTVIGVEGFPLIKNAGNVVRPFTLTKISIRTPPCVNSQKAQEKVLEKLRENPPYNATVELRAQEPVDGWAMKLLPENMKRLLDEASVASFGNKAAYVSEGGSIHFPKLFEEEFPDTFLLVTGLVSPDSNIHSANENFSIPYLKKLVFCISHILGNFYNQQ